MEEMRSSKGKPMARAVVARAWKELETLKREMRMLPKPKPLDVSPEAQSKRARRARQIEVYPTEVGWDPSIKPGEPGGPPK
jgi:hypothetical protein